METTDRLKAPGLKYRKRRNGPAVPVWVAAAAAVKAGYEPRTANLSLFVDDPALLKARCARLQAEMLMWLAGRAGQRTIFDGTFGAAIDLYLTDPDSPYHKLKPSSRHPYDVYAGKLKAHIGGRRIDACDGRDVQRWFAVWSDADENGGPRKLAAGRMAATVLKTVMRFGKIARLQACADFKAILDEIEFPALRPRPHAPTAEQVVAARQAAHAAGHHLRAFAYALQFETTLRQWDVTGQWVPLSDPRPSSLLAYGQKWIGPTWSRIDDEMILRLTPTKTEDTSEARVTIDLKECPMVMEELAAIPPELRTGPLIVFEKTGLPYRHWMFRESWRRDATKAGIPAEVWNRDLRAGGNTEGQKAGAAVADRRKVTGHTNERTTADVYDRDVLEAHRRVARARVKHRSGEP